MYDYGAYFSIIFFYILFYCALTSDRDHSSVSLNGVVPDWSEFSRGVVGIVGHACVCVVVNSYEKGVIFHFELNASIAYPFVFIA